MRRTVTLLLAPLFLVPALAAAALADPKHEPPVWPPNAPKAEHLDVQVGTRDMASGEWTVVPVPGRTLKVTNSAQRLWVFVRVQYATARANEVVPGALNVKISKSYDQSLNFVSQETYIYRGEGFFSKAGFPLPTEFEDYVASTSYDQFHQGPAQERLVPEDTRTKLANSFHSYYMMDEKEGYTLSPEMRRKLFCFMSSNDQGLAKESRLLHFNTTFQGSWIPFFIDLGRYGSMLRRIDFLASPIPGSADEERAFTLLLQ